MKLVDLKPSIYIDSSKEINYRDLNLKPVILLEYQNNAKEKNIEDKIPDITNLATKTTLNAKINEVKGEIPSITNLATKTALNAVENKIPSVSTSVKSWVKHKN